MNRAFHLGDILSITTGLLVSPRGMDGVHDILDYMTGTALFSHQLPRACAQCAPILLSQHPHLAAAQEPDAPAGSAWVEPWLAEQVRRFGVTLAVEPVPAAQRVVRDPIEELIAMRGGRTEGIVVVAVDDQPAHP